MDKSAESSSQPEGGIEPVTKGVPPSFSWRVHPIIWIVCVFICFDLIGLPLRNMIIVVLAYGRNAYFVEGLRIVNSKRGILSNGLRLNPLLDIGSMLLTFALCAAAAYFMMIAPSWILRKPAGRP